MKDYLNLFIEKIKAPGWVKSFVDHNRGLFFALLIVAAFAFPLIGCQFKAADPFHEGKQVTAAQLDAEVNVEVRDLQQQQADLNVKIADVKDKAAPGYAEIAGKQQAATAALTVVQGLVNQYAPAPFGGLAATALGVLTMGLGLDNSRKSRLLSQATADPGPGATPDQPLHAVIDPPAPPKV